MLERVERQLILDMNRSCHFLGFMNFAVVFWGKWPVFWPSERKNVFRYCFRLVRRKLNFPEKVSCFTVIVMPLTFFYTKRMLTTWWHKADCVNTFFEPRLHPYISFNQNKMNDLLTSKSHANSRNQDLTLKPIDSKSLIQQK